MLCARAAIGVGAPLGAACAVILALGVCVCVRLLLARGRHGDRDTYVVYNVRASLVCNNQHETDISELDLALWAAPYAVIRGPQSIKCVYCDRYGAPLPILERFADSQ